LVERWRSKGKAERDDRLQMDSQVARNCDGLFGEKGERRKRCERQQNSLRPDGVTNLDILIPHRTSMGLRTLPTQEVVEIFGLVVFKLPSAANQITS